MADGQTRHPSERGPRVYRFPAWPWFPALCWLSIFMTRRLPSPTPTWSSVSRACTLHAHRRGRRWTVPIHNLFAVMSADDDSTLSNITDKLVPITADGTTIIWTDDNDAHGPSGPRTPWTHASVDPPTHYSTKSPTAPKGISSGTSNSSSSAKCTQRCRSSERRRSYHRREALRRLPFDACMLHRARAPACKDLRPGCRAQCAREINLCGFFSGVQTKPGRVGKINNTLILGYSLQFM